MNVEDYAEIDAERDAEPRRFQTWDPNSEMAHREQILEHPTAKGVDKGITTSQPALANREFSSSSSGDDLRDARVCAHTSYKLHEVHTGDEDHAIHRHPIALERIAVHLRLHHHTVGSGPGKEEKKHKPLPPFGAGKPYPPPLPSREAFVVEFDGPHDPLHGQNWPLHKKLYNGAIYAFTAISTTLASSIFAPAIPAFTREYGIGQEVGTLGTSLFVMGYAVGPVIWAPGSELYGRRFPILIGSFGLSIFSISVATGKDVQTVIICRFFAGLFGSCPLAVVPAAMADLFDNTYRGLAIAVFSVMVSTGPLLGPFLGGFIATDLGWRWVEYISAFIGFLSFGLCVFFLHETYPPVILRDKAAELRRRTKNWGIHAKQEEVEVDIKSLLTKNFSRPIRLLMTEPIIFLTSLYSAFVYGLLYLFLTAYDIIFQHIYHMTPGVAGLTYFGMIFGQAVCFFVFWGLNPSYAKKLNANNNIPVPEWRLPLPMVGGILFSAGLFWMGWSGYTDRLHWIVPTLSGLLTGFGFFAIFLQMMNYLVDAYLMFAASAMASNAMLRSAFAGIFPLFATYMFDGMGVQWAMTLLGCVAALLAPMPYLFYIYGKRIRAKSKFAPAPDLVHDKMKDEEGALKGVNEK